LQGLDVFEALEDLLLGNGSILPIIGLAGFYLGKVLDEAVNGVYPELFKFFGCD
jgi:hypothetical protein